MDEALKIYFGYIYKALIAFLELIGQEELAAKIEEKVAEMEADAE